MKLKMSNSKFAHIILFGMLISIGCKQKAPNFDDILQKAANGDSDSQYLLGVMYYDGLYKPYDPAEGIRWFYNAAGNGNTRAQRKLGIVYKYGCPSIGIRKNIQESIKWFSLAATSGDEYSRIQLDENFHDRKVEYKPEG
jgi:TPR repeat protein